MGLFKSEMLIIKCHRVRTNSHRDRLIDSGNCACARSALLLCNVGFIYCPITPMMCRCVHTILDYNIISSLEFRFVYNISFLRTQL